MTYGEQGIYLNLLLLQFERGDLTMEKINRYLPKANDWIVEIKGILDEKFTKQENGTFRNERMAQVIQEQQKKSETRSHQTERARAAKKKKASSVTKTVTDIATETKNATNTSDCNGLTENVTASVTGRELELELELERELELKQEREALSARPKRLASELPSIVFAVQKWNELAQHEDRMATVAKITDRRKTKWETSRSKAGFLSAWLAALEKLPIANTATFKWQPSFDWMLSLDNVVKLSEGCYDTASEADERNKRVSRFINE